MTRSLDGRRLQTSTLNIRIILAKFRHKWYLTKNSDMNIGQQLDAMLGGYGGITVVTGAVTGQAFEFLVVNASTSFTTLTDSEGNNALTYLGLSGITVMTGMIVRARNGLKLAAVTVSGGNVFAYS